MSQRIQAKVALAGPDGDSETLWALVVGPDLYELDNLPWYAYRVSVGDIVEARADAEGQLRMTRVVKKSGNRTIRVILTLTPDGQQTFEAQQALAGVVKRGCSFEGANKMLTAINIPPEVELASLAEFLTATGFQWEYADPAYDDLFPGGGSETDSPEA